MTTTLRTKNLLAVVGAVGLGCVAASAGSFSNNFNASSSTNSLNFAGTLWDGVATTGTGSTAWRSTGGAGPIGNTTAAAATNGVVYGQDGDGFLQVTFASAACNGSFSSSLCGGVLFNDFDNGLVVAAFTFECDLRIGNGDPNPADGFSINYIRANDPILLAINAGDTLPGMNGKISANGGQFADNGGSGDLSLMEEGTTTGLSVGFDMWDSGNYTIPPASPAVGKVAAGITHDNIGLDIRVDDTLLTTIAMPNGTTDTADDDLGNALTQTDTVGTTATTNATSIETGPYDTTGCDTNLAWCHLKVVLDTNGVLNVFWKNTQILTNFNTSFFPSAGRLLMAARVGGNTANIDVDNVQITTIAASTLIIGNASATPVGVSISVSDSGPAVADTNSIKLAVDGTSVTPTSISKVGALTSIGYNTLPPFAAGSTQAITLTISDTNKQVYTATRDVVVPSYVSLPTTLAVANVDTTQPGFNVRSYHVNVPFLSATASKTWNDTMENSIRRAEEELFGLLGANDAVGGGTYTEPNVINYSITTNSTTGFGHFNITTDTNNPAHYTETGFPGIAQQNANGEDPTSDSFACEFMTYINFPEAGVYNIVFNSDDGFRMTAGNPANDVFNSTLISEFDGGRGATDSGMELYIAKAGYYPFRVIYFQGGGGGDCEWTIQEIYPHSYPLSLVNDSTASQPPVSGQFQAAYRAVLTGGTTPAAVTFIDPVVGSGTYAANIPISAAITDGTDGAIKSGSVAMYVNGAPVSPTSNKSGSVTTLKYQPNPLLPAGANTLAIVFTDASNNTQSNVVNFTVNSYTVVPASMALPQSVATSVGKSGFDVWTIKNMALAATATAGTTDYGMDNSVFRSELQVHAYGQPAIGVNSNSGEPAPMALGTLNLLGLTNTADLTVNWFFFGTGPGGSYPEGSVINYNGQAANNGNYNDGTASTMPGIPSINNTNDGDKNGQDNYSVEVQTVLYLTPGYYTMDVNSDDGFSVSVGNPAEWNTMRLVLGFADYGKGASDIDFNFVITTAGYYPFRCLYFEGGGGNNLEWAIETAYPTNGCYILLNDTGATATGGTTPICVPAYQYPAGTTKGSPYVSGYGPSKRRTSQNWTPYNFTHAGFDAPIWATLQDGETAITTSSVKLSVNGVSVSPTVSKSGTVTSVNYPAPTAGWVVGSTNTVALTFLDRTVTWQFDVENHKNATFFIEAEDFNYNSGQSVAAASTMPYLGGAYAGLSAVSGVDYQSNGDQDNPFYRPGTNPNQPVGDNYDLDRGVNELQANFRLGWIGSGEWFNYTRTVPAGTYNIYGGISNGGSAGGADGEYAILQVVDSPSSPTTTNNIGMFDSPNTGGWGFNGHLAPLVDPSGNLIQWTSTGTPTTFRYWLPASSTNAPITVAGISTLPKGGNGDWDFMLFTPPGRQNVVTQPTLKWTDAADAFVITYTGVLYSAPSAAGPWTKVSGASSPYTVTTSAAKMMFYVAGSE